MTGGFRVAAVITAGAALAFGLAVPAAPPAQAAAFLPTGFTETTHLGGLVAPTSTTFAPDGSVFVTEKRGIVKAFSSIADTSPTTTIDLRRNTHVWNDRGMAGITVDPQWPARPYVYFTYTLDAEPGGQPPRWGGTADTDGCPDATNGCVVTGRVSRIQVDPATGAAAGPEQPLLTDYCQQFGSHSIDDIAFGPDGMLYVSAGEGASYSFSDWGQQGNTCMDPPTPGSSLSAPTARGGSLRSQSPRRPANEAASLSGTVVRINPDTGAPAAGNPFIAAPDTIRRHVVAYGLRNPFRFAFRPGTSELWVGDVGQNNSEEINLLANATDSTAENFGWPCFEGNVRLGGFDNANLDMCESLYTEASAVLPAFRYSHDSAVVPGEACSTGSSSISALAFYTGASYPSKYRNGLFFGDYARSCLWYAPPGASGRPDFSKVETFATANGTFRPVDLDVGPNGDLFVTDVAGGILRRFTFTTGNQAPTASVTATPTSGSAPLAVSFDARGSRDPEGQALSYSWDLDGNGTFGDATTATASRTYTSPGDVTVAVRVTDPQGASGQASVTIRVGNDAPVVTITDPAPGSTWAVGDPIRLVGTATDAQEGALPESALDWSVVIKHCPSNCHEHLLGTWNGVRSVDLVAPDHEYPSWLEVTLTGRDSQGLSSTVTRKLDPTTVDLSLRTQPAGLRLGAGFEVSTTPFEQRVIVGSVNSLFAPATQTLNGRVYEFRSWSNGGAADQLLVAPAQPVTLTATYEDVGPAAGDTTPPSSPSPVAGGWEQGVATVTWGASTDDTGVARYVVHRSLTSGFLPTGSTGVGTTNDLTFTQTGLAPGRYYYRVVAEDAEGNASSPSAQVEVVVPDDTVPPASPTALSAATAGDEVALWWTPPAGESGLTFEVHRSVAEGFSPTAATRVAETTSADWRDQDLAAGTWHYRVVARDQAGNRSDPSTAVRAVVTSEGATTVVRDGFRRAATGAWGTAENGGAWSLSRAASFGVNGERGTITNETAGSDRAAWLASSDVRDVDTTVVFRTDTKVVSGNGQTLKVLSRRQASNHEYRASVNLRGDGSMTLGLRRQLPGVTESGPTVAAGGFTRGRDYAVRVSVTGANPTTLRAKVWDVSTPEPVGWGITWTDSTASLQVAGDVGIASYISGSATGTPVTTAVDLVMTGTAAGTDTTAPSTPGTPTTTVSGDTVTVRWPAATDNVGVTGYRVYRGETSGFTVVTGGLRGTVDGSTLTFDDRTVPAGRHFYRVLAVDAAGNTGPLSAAAEASVGGGAQEQVVSVVSAADTWANSAAATATAGTSWVFRARGGSSPQVPYLRFSLPAPPAGTSLASAVLQVVTSANSWSGSAGGYEVRLVADNSWQEGTLTWNNRPAVSSTVLGSVPAGTGVSQVVQVPLSVSGLPASTGGPVSIALSSASTDNLEVFTKENPTSKPTLILTYR